MKKYSKSCKALIGLICLTSTASISSAYAADQPVLSETQTSVESKTAPVDSASANSAETKTETKVETTGTAAKSESKAYILRLTGIALPLKAATMDGVNLLGGPILSLTLPVNISGYIKPGLNHLDIEYISDPQKEFTITIEKRTPGPKTEEIAKITVPANDSKGKVAKKTLSFNIAKGEETRTITSLSDADKKAILDQFENYYNTLKEHKAEKLKQLYKTCLESERKLVPETTRFFEKVVNREAQKVRNPNIELPALDKQGLAFKIEGDKVRLYRENNKALLLSNEIEVPPSSVMFEVQPPVPVKSTSKVTSKTNSKAKSDKDAKGSKTTATSVGSAPVAALVTAQESSSVGTPDEKEMQVMNRVHGVEKDIKETTAAPSPAAPKSLIKENLVRFNLYFMKDESAQGDGAWTLAIPPNV